MNERVMMGRESTGKGAAENVDGNCGNYGHRAETCWAASSTKPTEKGQGSKDMEGKQVNVLDEQEKQLRNAFCTVSFNAMSDEVEDDWTEVERGRRRKPSSRSF